MQTSDGKSRDVADNQRARVIKSETKQQRRDIGPALLGTTTQKEY